MMTNLGDRDCMETTYWLKKFHKVNLAALDIEDAVIDFRRDAQSVDKIRNELRRDNENAPGFHKDSGENIELVYGHMTFMKNT